MLGFLDPEKVLREMALEENMTAAEFGCGSGKFVLLLAKKLKEGRVYGIDIQSEPLAVLKNRAQAERVFNIQTAKGDLEKKGGSTLPDQYLDVGLIPNLLFQVEDKKAVIGEAKRILRRGGKMAIIDWKADASLDLGKGKRIPVEQMKSWAEEAGFKIEKEFEAGDYHYGLVFLKP